MAYLFGYIDMLGYGSESLRQLHAMFCPVLTRGFLRNTVNLQREQMVRIDHVAGIV